MGECIFSNLIANGIGRIFLQMALTNVQDLVPSTSDMESETLTVCDFLFACNLLRGKPTCLTKGKFYLIAIKIRFVTTYNRQDLLRGYPSQSLKIVLYLFLFVVELTLVVHMLPLAPSTIGEVLTYGDYSQWRFLVELHCCPFIESLFFLGHQYIYNILRHRIIYKDNTTIRSMCDAFSFSTCIGYGNIFYQKRFFVFSHVNILMKEIKK